MWQSYAALRFRVNPTPLSLPVCLQVTSSASGWRTMGKSLPLKCL